MDFFTNTIPVFIHFLQLTSSSLSHAILPLKAEVMGMSLESSAMRLRNYTYLNPNDTERIQLLCSDVASPTPVGKGEGGVLWKDRIWLLTKKEDELIQEQLWALFQFPINP